MFTLLIHLKVNTITFYASLFLLFVAFSYLIFYCILVAFICFTDFRFVLFLGLFIFVCLFKLEMSSR